MDRVAPDNVALSQGTPRISAPARVNVAHRLGSEVTDSRLKADAAVGLYNQQPIEADSAADEATK
jgi:hypothetical protein